MSDRPCTVLDSCTSRSKRMTKRRCKGDDLLREGVSVTVLRMNGPTLRRRLGPGVPGRRTHSG
jgi:hypothetical protein